MNRKISLLAIFASVIILTGSGCSKITTSEKNNLENNEENKTVEQTTQTDKTSDTSAIQTEPEENKFFITYSTYNKEKITKDITYFSVYKSDGTLIKKIEAPADTAKDVFGSKVEVFGKRIYYLSGSKKETSIGEVDPFTGDKRVFDFTQTKTKLTSANAITTWSVSKDNEKIAWADTAGNLYISNMDGSNKKSYSVDSKWVEFSENSSIIYVQNSDGVQKFDTEKNVFTPIVKSSGSNFLIGKNHVVYANTETSFIIRDIASGKEVAVNPPSPCDILSLSGFSTDEKTIYFYTAFYGKPSIYYSVENNGKNIAIIKEKSMQGYLYFFAGNLAVKNCVSDDLGAEDTCIIDVSAKKESKRIPKEIFVGILE